ncbi:MAG: hypothetical protein HFF03_07530 [Oscillospiraceae bacterium]|nr:hypothetical protein [Oscillospiraceae bacterium]
MYMEEPIKMREGEAPTITIESNAVVDRWYDPEGPESAADYLTGELEVVIRAKSGCVIGEGGSEEWQGFNTLGVALKYSPLLEPYQWTDGEKAIDLTGTSVFDEMTNQQTLKDKNVTTAMAQVSGKTGEGGYLYFNVEANRPIVLKEDTVLAVVTFRYDLETVGPILAEDAAQWLTPVKSDDSTGGGTGDGGDAGTDGGETTRTATDCLIQFATVADLEDHSQLCELVYSSAYGENFDHFNTMYYSDPASGVGVEAKDPADGSVSIDYNRLNLSIDYNNVEEHKVNFSLVNRPSYNDGGLTLDDLATVLFYDWDDTLLGVLIVPRNGDARQVVNTYVHDNLIHPDLRDNTNYSSLARKDNYRGKYPSSGPAADGATDGTEVTDGDNYLTGKLDYAFFKRPMVQDKTDPNVWTQTTNADDDTKAQWDDKYPWIHGWAIVDYAHPENTWTTLGVGELTAYPTTTSTGGGYRELNDAPAQLTVSGQNFTFANFDFRRTNSLEPGSIYAVKAVYEPGTDLMSDAAGYRMITEPSYNKFNFLSAEGGGAYSVNVTFERAVLSVPNGADADATKLVFGVPRMREPVVRQQTTTDLRWESNEELGVNHNLPNASLDSASKDRDKTTYTKVDIINTEEVKISLALSARQNKVDYFLIDAYGLNFVSGGERSSSNFGREDASFDKDNYDKFSHAKADFTVDNYNYYVAGESEDRDSSGHYFDVVRFVDKNGSHGFVLYGTLNNLLQKASDLENKKITEEEFNNYVSADTMTDANLRADSGGSEPGFSTQAAMRQAIRDAAVAAQTHKGAADEADYWDATLGCARLTYHQLQWYIINGTLLDPVTADDANHILGFCHLHAACAATTSKKPKDWPDLIDAAGSSDPERQEAIGQLTAKEIEELTHLRTDANGSPYTKSTDFQRDIIDAVAAGCTSWDEIQYHIINKAVSSDDVEVSRANYWWYDGVTSVPMGSWSDLISAAKDAITAPTLPDGTAAGTRTAKLNRVESAFNSNASATGAAPIWVTITENLAATDEGDKFTDYDEFRSRFLDAMSDAKTAGVSNPSWFQIQYAILHHGESGYTFPGTTDPEFDTYWWHNGVTKIVDIESLLNALKANNTTILNLLTKEEVNGTPLYLRKDFAGSEFDSVAELITAIGDTTALPSDVNDWTTLQYYLIHNRTLDAAAAPGEAGNYYWWQNGGSYTAPTILSGNLNQMINAAFVSVYNGNTLAWDGLTANKLKATNLRKVAGFDIANTAKFSDLPEYEAADLAAFQASMEALVQTALASESHPHTPPALTWYQVQHYLNTGTYEADENNITDKEIVYWWPDGKNNPNVTVTTEFTRLIAAMRDFKAGTMTEAAFKAMIVGPASQSSNTKISLSVAGETNFYATAANLNSGKQGYTALQVSAAKTALTNLTKAISDAEIATLTWAQVQYALLYKGAYTTTPPIYPGDPTATASLFFAQPNFMMTVPIPLTPEEQLADLTQQISDITAAIQEDPTLLEDHLQQINELLAAADALKVLVSGEPVETLPGEEPSLDPTNPEEPGEPTDSETPTEPGEPTEPTDPEAPTEPGETTEPTDPEAPTEPGETTEPTDPESPTDPVDPTEPETPTGPVDPEEPKEPETGALPDFANPPEETPPLTEEPEGKGEDPDPPEETPKEETAEPAGSQTPEEAGEGGADAMKKEELTTPDVMTTAYRRQLTTRFNSLTRLRAWPWLEPLKLSGLNISRMSGSGTAGPPRPNVSRLSLDLSHIFAAGRITA